MKQSCAENEVISKHATSQGQHMQMSLTFDLVRQSISMATQHKRLAQLDMHTSTLIHTVEYEDYHDENTGLSMVRFFARMQVVLMNVTQAYLW